MGRLAGFNYREVIRRLRKAGFEYDRPAKGSHEGTVRAVLRGARIDTDAFLALG